MKIVLFLCLTVGACAQQYTISAVAGSNFLGDNGPATSALLSNPQAAVVDGGGNLFIADAANNGVRKVTPDGIIVTVASSLTGFPAALAVDSSGNLFFSDLTLNQIQRVGTDGKTSVVAGTGFSGFSGDGGPATAARLFAPSGLVFDAGGNLYFVDNGNNLIRKITADGTITTVAGTRSPGFSGDGGPALDAQFWFGTGLPAGLALDASGNLIVADTENGRVRIISAADGTVQTLAGGGPRSANSADEGAATAASLASPTGVAVDAGGDIFVAELNGNRVREVTPDGIIRTVAGTQQGFAGDGGPAAAAQLRFPFGVAFDNSGNLIVTDSGNDRVRRVTADGTIQTIAGAPSYGGDGGAATAALLYHPSGLALAGDGTLYIGDWGNHRGSGKWGRMPPSRRGTLCDRRRPSTPAVTSTYLMAEWCAVSLPTARLQRSRAGETTIETTSPQRTPS